MESDTESKHSTSKNSLEIGETIETDLGLKSPKLPEIEKDIQTNIDKLRNNIQPNNGKEISTQHDDAIETIDVRKHTIQINKQKLERIKEEYGISDWNIQFDPKFSLKPSRVVWNEKVVTIRPFNLWSYLSVGTSIEKRNQRLPKLFAHELRHTQQEPPDNSLKGKLSSARFAYWFHPAEIDSREWSAEHWEEFKGVVIKSTINDVDESINVGGLTERSSNLLHAEQWEQGNYKSSIILSNANNL